jgi:hypothetical protein
MASADITVIPTGGSTPVDLADLAAKVVALPSPTLAIPTGSHYYSGQFLMFLSKQTGVIEDVVFTIDATVVTVQGWIGASPDGLYDMELRLAPGTTGTHTVECVAQVTGATVSVTYTI